MLGSCVESYLETEFVSGHVAADDAAVRSGFKVVVVVKRDLTTTLALLVFSS